MVENVLIVGLCGRSGSGKGYVCDLFRRYGIPSVDTDAVYRDIVDCGYPEDNSCLFELREEFGDTIIRRGGGLDRRKLADIVFCDHNEDSLKRLNEITHKYILKRTLDLVSEFGLLGYRCVIIDAPVLFESGFDRICDHTICVTAPLEVAVLRICNRDEITPEKAKSRLAGQMSESRLRALCDMEIYNDGVSDVEEQVVNIIEYFGLVGGLHEKQ